MELYFNMSYELLGQTRTVDLISGGSSIPVTEANKADYINKVHAYICIPIVSLLYGTALLSTTNTRKPFGIQYFTLINSL